MRARMMKWGNSLAVRIPKTVAEATSLKEGDAIEIEVAEEGMIQLLRAGDGPTLERLVSQITPLNRYAEVVAGTEQRGKAVEW